MVESCHISCGLPDMPDMQSGSVWVPTTTMASMISTSVAVLLLWLSVWISLLLLSECGVMAAVVAVVAVVVVVVDVVAVVSSGQRFLLSVLA